MLKLACQWIRLAFRPLVLDELTEGVAMSLDFQRAGCSCCSAGQMRVTAPVLLELCHEILEVQPDGKVKFYNEEIQLLLSSPQNELFESSQAGHEILAMVCLTHFEYMEHGTMLQPWKGFTNHFTTDGHPLRHFLREYSTTQWHKHYRAAELKSQILPAFLNSKIEKMAQVLLDPMITGPDRLHFKNTLGLEVAFLYDLPVLGKTYLRMGADINANGLSTFEPLLITAAKSAPSLRGALSIPDLDAHIDQPRCPTHDTDSFMKSSWTRTNVSTTPTSPTMSSLSSSCCSSSFSSSSCLDDDHDDDDWEMTTSTDIG